MSRVFVCLSVWQNVAELKEQLQSKQKEHEIALHALKDQVNITSVFTVGLYLVLHEEVHSHFAALYSQTSLSWSVAPF